MEILCNYSQNPVVGSSKSSHTEHEPVSVSAKVQDTTASQRRNINCTSSNIFSSLQHAHLPVASNPNVLFKNELTENYSDNLAPRISPYLLGMLQCRPVSLPLTRNVVKEGWLMKRGEHIKNWRRRYFKLREDGTFYGYKIQPKDDMAQPLNNFTVRDCQIICLNKPKPYTFLIRGLQWTNVVERLFFVETEAERNYWLSAIQSVANRLKSSFEQPVSVHSLDLAENMIVDIPQRKKKLFIQENRVLQQCKHPFMTELRYSFTTPNYLCFVMEYVNGGELFFHLQRDRVFSEERAKFYGAEITLALGYLHHQNVVYR
uniref:PH domain-containing protein n=1 Tax=Schistosoma curassoni TaxID=6186 RepID=A0A183KTP4_9TREM